MPSSLNSQLPLWIPTVYTAARVEIPLLLKRASGKHSFGIRSHFFLWPRGRTWYSPLSALSSHLIPPALAQSTLAMLIFLLFPENAKLVATTGSWPETPAPRIITWHFIPFSTSIWNFRQANIPTYSSFPIFPGQILYTTYFIFLDAIYLFHKLYIYSFTLYFPD